METTAHSSNLIIRYAIEFTPDEKLMTIGETARMVKKSSPTIYRLMRKSQFPRNINVGGRSLWLRSEIIAYLSNCVEERNNKVGA